MNISTTTFQKTKKKGVQKGRQDDECSSENVPTTTDIKSRWLAAEKVTNRRASS